MTTKATISTTLIRLRI